MEEVKRGSGASGGGEDEETSGVEPVDLSLNAIEVELEKLEEEAHTASKEKEEIDEFQTSGICNEAYLGHDRSKKETSLDVNLVGEDAQTTFETLMLKPEIVEGLRDYQYIKPSPIQMKAIPFGKFGYDLIMQSKSGTGKTCAFGVIILEQLELLAGTEEDAHVQALILAPTREIAEQNSMTLKCIGSKMQGLKVKVFIGGTSVEQSKRRSKRCNVASGCPGRILHMISANEMDLSKIKIVVLDEADRLMEAPFLADVVAIFNSLPKVKQVVAASATYSDELKSFVKRFMNNPEDITVSNATSNLLGVELYTAHVNKILNKDKQSIPGPERFDNKMAVVLEIIKQLKYTQAIIFSRFVMQAQKIYEELQDCSFDVALLTGARAQDDRLNALRDAKEGKCKILITSDLGSRGIDCEGIDLAINFECPDNADTFIHRFGRAGRFGGNGTSITLVEYLSDYQDLAALLKSSNIRVSRLESLEDLESLAKHRTDKFHKLYLRNERISTMEECNKGWNEFLRRCMNEDIPVTSLILETHIGIHIDASTISQKRHLLENMFDEYDKGSSDEDDTASSSGDDDD